MKLKGLLSEPIFPVFARIDLKHAYLKLSDGTGTPVVLTVKIGEGNLTYSEKRNMDYLLDRGNLDDVQEGDQVPMDVSIDFTWEYLTGEGGTGDAGSFEEFLKRTGAYSSNESTDADACRPYAVNIIIEYLPVPSSCGDKETITLTDFRYEELGHDLSGSSVSCSGRCNAVVATILREAQ